MVAKPDLRGCCAVILGDFFPTFRSNVLPSFSRLWFNPRTHNPEEGGGTFLLNVVMKLTCNKAQQHRRP